MICTENEEIADRCRLMRLHGINDDSWHRYSDQGSWYYEVIAPGFKYNFTDIQAALGLVQLKRANFLWDVRKSIAQKYDDAFSNNELIKIPAKLTDRESSYHLYSIQLDIDKLKISRSQFIEELKTMGIGSSVHFIPLYRHPFYKNNIGLKEKDFPNSEFIFPRLVSLPIWRGMTDYQVSKVIDCVTSILEKNKM